MFQISPNELFTTIVLALGVVVWRMIIGRITALEQNKVDKTECKLREKQEDQAFNRIDSTLDKLEKTFDYKSTDVVGKMSSVVATMDDILEEIQDKRTRRRKR